MDTTITIKINTEDQKCTIQEKDAESVEYDIDISSYESIAYSVGEAVSDYLQGLG